MVGAAMVATVAGVGAWVMAGAMWGPAADRGTLLQHRCLGVEGPGPDLWDHDAMEVGIIFCADSCFFFFMY